ncbi:MAG: hypothetical protein C4320_05110 [Armatimonadota bacterium]
MTVLLFERNLLWSVRLRNAFAALGHEARTGNEAAPADLAVVNLSEGDRVAEVIAGLKELGVPILAHAGHKEKELMRLGKELGVERLATNGQLASDLPDLLQRMGFPHNLPVIEPVSDQN